MKLINSTLLALLASPITAWHKGLNIGANNPDGSCKTQDDWLRAFNTMKSLPPAFTSARLFASSDCGTLANAVPAALNAGVKLLLGVWTQDDGHFNAEKQAVLDALAKFPNWEDWMLAVSVGSEDLYRKEVPASQIAQKIYDVRGMLREKGVTAWVGHVDTWTAWVDGANADVLRAVDFVGSDGYPFWQGATVSESPDVFWKSVQDVQNTVNSIKPGTPVWVTETGWPVTGKSFGAAEASATNAQGFWKAVACPAFPKIDVFWYAYQDPSANPSFGLVDGSNRPLYDLTC